MEEAYIFHLTSTPPNAVSSGEHVHTCHLHVWREEEETSSAVLNPPTDSERECHFHSLNEDRNLEVQRFTQSLSAS